MVFPSVHMVGERVPCDLCLTNGIIASRHMYGDPFVNRQTDIPESITFQQTTFTYAGDKRPQKLRLPLPQTILINGSLLVNTHFSLCYLVKTQTWFNFIANNENIPHRLLIFLRGSS